MKQLVSKFTLTANLEDVPSDFLSRCVAEACVGWRDIRGPKG